MLKHYNINVIKFIYLYRRRWLWRWLSNTCICAPLLFRIWTSWWWRWWMGVCRSVGMWGIGAHVHTHCYTPQLHPCKGWHARNIMAHFLRSLPLFYHASTTGFLRQLSIADPLKKQAKTILLCKESCIQLHNSQIFY